MPTSIQMIMYRRGIPLIPAEELGYHLGLTVKPEEGELFYNVRTSATPPYPAGWGTWVIDSRYELNAVFGKLGIPLGFSRTCVSEIADEADLLARLRTVEQRDHDALLCFNHGVIRGNYEPNTGHVTVFDRVVNNQVRIVDASPCHPKWRLVDAVVLWEAISRHDDSNVGGIWHFTPTAS